MNDQPTVFVVDDEPRMRESLVELLDAAGYRTRSFASAEEFLEQHDANSSGCLILDVYLGDMDGLQLQLELTARSIHLPVIVISGFAEVPNVVRAIKAGAFDFLEKPFADQVLLDRIEQALATERKVRRDSERFQLLSPREREVADLLVAGKESKQIGLELGISHKTVNIHRSNIFVKMQVSNVVELANLQHRIRAQT